MLPQLSKLALPCLCQSHLTKGKKLNLFRWNFDSIIHVNNSCYNQIMHLNTTIFILFHYMWTVVSPQSRNTFSVNNITNTVSLCASHILPPKATTKNASDFLIQKPLQNKDAQGTYLNTDCNPQSVFLHLNFSLSHLTIQF